LLNSLALQEAFIAVVVVVVGSVTLFALAAISFLWRHKHHRQKIVGHLVIPAEDLQIINLPAVS